MLQLHADLLVWPLAAVSGSGGDPCAAVQASALTLLGNIAYCHAVQRDAEAAAGQAEVEAGEPLWVRKVLSLVPRLLVKTDPLFCLRHTGHTPPFIIVNHSLSSSSSSSKN